MMIACLCGMVCEDCFLNVCSVFLMMIVWVWMICEGRSFSQHMLGFLDDDCVFVFVEVECSLKLIFVTRSSVSWWLCSVWVCVFSNDLWWYDYATCSTIPAVFLVRGIEFCVFVVKWSLMNGDIIGWVILTLTGMFVLKRQRMQRKVGILWDELESGGLFQEASQPTQHHSFQQRLQLGRDLLYHSSHRSLCGRCISRKIFHNCSFLNHLCYCKFFLAQLWTCFVFK